MSHIQDPPLRSLILLLIFIVIGAQAGPIRRDQSKTALAADHSPLLAAHADRESSLESASWTEDMREIWGRPQCAERPPIQGKQVHVSTVPELQAAVRNLRSDTSILLADGIYDLENTLHIQGGLEGVQIRGASEKAASVVLRGRGMGNADFGNVPHGFLIGDVQGLLIADLTVRDVYYHAIQVAGEKGPRDLTFFGLRLLDAGEQIVKGSSRGHPGPYADQVTVACSWLGFSDRARSDYTNGVDVLAGADWVVRDNFFARIRAPEGELAGPAVLFWRNSLRTIVERNYFVDCDRAIALGLAAPDESKARDAEVRFDHQEGIVRNNMIFRGPDSAGDIGISVNHHPNFAILHNTVIQNGTFPFGTIEYRFESSRGVIAGNLGDGPVWQRNNAMANLSNNRMDAQASVFVNAEQGDLHLNSEARALIDQVDLSEGVLDDFDGRRRPNGARADIGADEWESPAPDPSPSPTPTPASKSKSKSRSRSRSRSYRV